MLLGLVYTASATTVSTKDVIRGVTYDKYSIPVTTEELRKDLTDVLLKHNAIKLVEEKILEDVNLAIVEKPTILPEVIVTPENVEPENEKVATNDAVNNVANEINKTSKNVLDSIKTDTCKTCHGNDLTKSALNKSLDITKMNKDEFTKAMLGYQNGTYGGTLKSIMKIHADKYKSVEEITELYDIIQSISNKGDLK
jgi:cytochrome c553